MARLKAFVAVLGAVVLLSAEGPRAEETDPEAGSGPFVMFESGDVGQARRLILFVDGGPDATDPTDGAVVARALSGDGVDVALVRTDDARSREDAIEALKTLAPSYAADRVFALGRGMGGETVTALALDPPADTPRIVSAVTLNADLTALIRASGDPHEVLPTEPDRSDAPRLLFLSRLGAQPAAISARRLAKELRAAGAPFANDLIVPPQPDRVFWKRGRDFPLHAILNHFGAPALPAGMLAKLDAEYRHKTPVFSDDEVWNGAAPVRDYPITPDFEQLIRRMLAERPELPTAFPLKRYYAVDLLEWLDTLPPDKVGEGKHLVVTSARGERFFLTREQIERAKLQLVLGIDDERNLFRLVIAYQRRADYTWLSVPLPRPWLVRPLGAFLYAPVADGAGVFHRMRTTTQTALVAGSFRWQAEDPLAPLQDMPEEDRRTLVDTGCLECHGFRGVGGLSFHIGAFSGEPESGLGLPLTEYPDRVLEHFLFDQERVARTIGVNPVPMETDLAEKLRDIVSAEKDDPN